MIKNIRIVSLSKGIIGESYVKHELDIGVRRLEGMGLNVSFSKHALMGIEYIENHPEARAADLIEAFCDKSVDMILCAIGGTDTYRLLPHLFENDELKNAVHGNYKPFLGFSDTTINHLMLHKLGVNTFYGQSFLADICELDKEMLPYTKKYFEELIATGTIREITPSEVWYEERTDFGVSAVGTPCPVHKNGGFELLRGKSTFSGKVLGGCIDTLYDIFTVTYHPDMPETCAKYELFPTAGDWRDRILLLESSEERPEPEKFRAALECFKQKGVFDGISGILVGKPQDEVYHDEYRKALLEVVPEHIPIVCNISIGHAKPRCIIPFGVAAHVDAEKQIIRFYEE